VRELFKKIPKKKVSDKVFDQVKSLIVTGKLLPGQKIPSEMDLIGLFAVSRSSVREAILRLECLGFVEQRHGEGTFVKSATEAVVLDYMTEISRETDFMSGLMEIRNVLEVWAARTAAARATDENIGVLMNIITAMKARRKPEPPRFDHNVTLHRQIVAATHNPFLIHMMGSILGWIGTVTHQIYENPRTAPELYQEITRQHCQVVDAIIDRDEAAAEQAMAAHLEFVSHRITN
jgi:GntR family transcriptional repressor for pyruvate dehydrogenase complex